MVVTLTNVPVPKVNPAGPYSTFHAVSEPPAVQPKSAPVVVALLTAKAVGVKHDGQFPEPTAVIVVFPEPIIFPKPSVTSQVISPG